MCLLQVVKKSLVSLVTYVCGDYLEHFGEFDHVTQLTHWGPRDAYMRQ